MQHMETTCQEFNYHKNLMHNFSTVFSPLQCTSQYL